MWRGKPERVPWCYSVHHSISLTSLNPHVIHLRGFLVVHQIHIQGFLRLIQGWFVPLISLFHSFVGMVHWYLLLCLGNLNLQYQFFFISIHLQFFLILYFIWKTIKNIKKTKQNANTTPSTLLQSRGCIFRQLGHFLWAPWVSFLPPWGSFSPPCVLTGHLWMKQNYSLFSF